MSVSGEGSVGGGKTLLRKQYLSVALIRFVRWYSDSYSFQEECTSPPLWSLVWLHNLLWPMRCEQNGCRLYEPACALPHLSLLAAVQVERALPSVWVPERQWWTVPHLAWTRNVSVVWGMEIWRTTCYYSTAHPILTNSPQGSEEYMQVARIGRDFQEGEKARTKALGYQETVVVWGTKWTTDNKERSNQKRGWKAIS